jgi:superfamily I DNA and/or RNA helicase
VSGTQNYGENDSPYNLEEIKAVHQTVSQLQTLGIKKDQIGIITPYREQRKLLKNEIGHRGPEIDTYFPELIEKLVFCRREN